MELSGSQIFIVVMFNGKSHQDEGRKSNHNRAKMVTYSCINWALKFLH